jgi:hypothetical protein
VYEQISLEVYSKQVDTGLSNRMISIFKGRDTKELAFRFYQYIWNTYDRLSLQTRIKGTGQRAKGDLEQCRFFLGSDELSSIASIYGDRPKDQRLLLQRADTICSHRFDLLGYKDLNFERNGLIDWHFDPVHDVSLQKEWWQKMLRPTSILGADPKIVWELNRHHHLVTLAQAFVISGDDRYRGEIVLQLSQWLTANPPKYGINWSSSLELAFRLIAWLWVWFLCGKEKAFGRLTDQFIAALVTHADHIENNLSVYFSPNTHLSGEALGLYYIGVLMPGLKGAQRWRSIGEQWLMRCLEDHVLIDGGYMERSLWYHRYTTDFYLHFYLLSLKNLDSTAKSLEKPLQQLGNFLMYSMQPDRKLPNVGDDDGGRLLALDGLPGNDPRGTLDTLAAIFDSGHFISFTDAFPEEAIWLLGPRAIASFKPDISQGPEEVSKIFTETGYAFLRSGWKEDDVCVTFDCGPHGWFNCGHAHADMLSIQLYAREKALISDPGTYSYQEPWRDWFRCSESHAVMRVDGKYPAIPAAPFQWSKVPDLKTLKHRFDRQIDYVAGVMDAGSWQHSREIFFLKPDLIVLLDTIEAEGNHEIEARFPLADTEWDITDGVCTSTLSDRRCSIQWDTGLQHCAELAEGWQSKCYGQRDAAKILVFKVLSKTPCTLATLVNLSSIEHCLQRVRQNGREIFSVETCHDKRTVATVRCSLQEDSVCAAFVG